MEGWIARWGAQQHLRPEEPDVAALDDAVAEGDEAASKHHKPEVRRGKQVLRHAVLLHVILLQRLLHQRVQYLRTHTSLLALPIKLVCHASPWGAPDSKIPVLTSFTTSASCISWQRSATCFYTCT